MWNEAGQRLIEFCQENALVIANTLFQQHKRKLHMDITRWSTPKSDWLYSLQPKMEKLYTVNENKTRSWLWLRSWTPYCQIQTYIEESKENHQTIQAWPNQLPHDYTVEVTKRFKGLDLTDRVPNELWTEVHDIVQETRSKTILKKKKCKKAKWLSEEGGLTNSCEKKRSEKQRRKWKTYPFEHRVPKNSKER